VEALMRRAPELYDVEIVHMMTMGCAPYVAPEMADISGTTRCLSAATCGRPSTTAGPTTLRFI
jgi:hypothetical protein